MSTWPMSDRPTFYTIGADRVPLPCFDTLEWGHWHRTSRDACRVGSDHVGDAWVSTVFLGIDHNWGASGDPLLFETMVFLADDDYGEMDRYRSWAEAAAGHERIRSMLAVETANAERITLAALRALLNQKVTP